MLLCCLVASMPLLLLLHIVTLVAQVGAIIALLLSSVCLLLQTQSTFPNFHPPGRPWPSQKSVELFRVAEKELQDG